MAATATLDNHTTNAIREALGAASRGQLGEACQIGERALADGGDPVALNAMLGMFRCQLGEIEAGIQHLRIAHEARPADSKIAINLANALATGGHHQDAFDLLTPELARSDRSLHLLKLRGFLAQNIGEFQASIEAYEEVISADPTDFASWNNLGNARLGAEDFEGSVPALRRAAELASDSGPIRLNIATALVHTGDWNAAEAELRQMGEDFPDDPRPLRELHSLLKQWGQDQEALEAIELAVERAPEDVELLLGLAAHFSYMVNSTDAEATYRRVLELDHDNALAHLGLAVHWNFRPSLSIKL